MPKSSFGPIDLGDDGTTTAERWQKRLLTRISVLALLAVGALGVWMMFDAILPQAPPSLKADQKAGGTVPDKALPIVAPPAPSPPAALPSAVALPTVPPLAEPSPILPIAPDVAAPPVHQGVIAQSEIPPPSPVFVSQPLTAKTAGKHQFGVQMGVFRITTNAEKLHAKIRSQDIPVVMETRPGETRVHAGPFASRAEAEHVRARLEAAGMGKGMLVILLH